MATSKQPNQIASCGARGHASSITQKRACDCLPDQRVSPSLRSVPNLERTSSLKGKYHCFYILVRFKAAFSFFIITSISHQFY